MLHATCTDYHSYGFFIIMSPAESLHFSALVTQGRAVASGYSSLLVCLSVCFFITSISTHLNAIALRLQHR